MTERESLTRVHVIAADIDILRNVLRKYRWSVAGGVRKREDGRVGVDAYLRPAEVEMLRDQSVELEVIADATAVGEQRQAEIGEGNRYQDGSVPRGLGELNGGER